MIIKSTFKDYYDFVAHIYGGGDPKIFYPRIRLGEKNKVYDYYPGLPAPEMEGRFPSLPIRYSGNLEFPFDFKWISIVGKFYLLVRESREVGTGDIYIEENKWELLVEGKYPKLDKALFRKTMIFGRLTYDSYVGVPSKELVLLSRRLKAPVFGFEYNSAIVDSTIPILGDIGIASIIPPEQMYQEISYFMGNIINEVPDLQPAGKPPMTDKEKIISHGLDLKISFRHRKK